VCFDRFHAGHTAVELFLSASCSCSRIDCREPEAHQTACEVDALSRKLCRLDDGDLVSAAGLFRIADIRNELCLTALNTETFRRLERFVDDTLSSGQPLAKKKR
jgi:hypothetical protein